MLWSGIFKEEIIKEKILNCKLSFPKKDFNNISKDVIEYIKQLLQYEPEKRLSAEEALENNWLKNMSEKNDKEEIYLNL